MSAVHRRPLMVLVVVLGGVVGTTARAALGHAWPHEEDGFPAATAAVNVAGAFLLGLLLTRLLAAGPETRLRLLLRLGLGTGVLGGLTTFSGLALDVVTLVRAQAPVLAVVYGLGSVVVGVAACALGVVLGGRRTGGPGRRRGPGGAR